MSMVESKKRLFADDEVHSPSKKRILAGVDGSPEVEGGFEEADETTEVDNLETFRKEAIYRRMKFYSREHERGQVRIADLEQRKTTCEAGLIAIAACWQQLVETVRTLTKPDDLLSPDEEYPNILDLSQHVSTELGLKAALESNMHETQKLITKFARLSDGTHPSITHEDAVERSQKLQTECLGLRSEIALIKSQLRDVEAEKEHCHDQLVTAENRLERLRSKSVVAMQSRIASGDQVSNATKNQQTSLSKSASPHPATNGHVQDPSELVELHALVKDKESRIAELERLNGALTDELATLKLDLKSPSSSIIMESPEYRILLNHASHLEHIASENLTELTELRKKVDELETSRKNFQWEVHNAADQAQQEFKSMLSKRDSDIARLRDQREQQASELLERKQKDSLKTATLHELKTLCESRAERIAVLESEVSRHKAKLSATAGDEDLMKYFFEGKVDDVEFIYVLQRKFQDAENRVTALEQTFSIFREDHPDIVQHMEAEAEARQQLSATLKQLESYRSTYGNADELPPDIQKMSEQLQRKENELLKLRLLDKQRGQAEASLFAEIDRLSASWETLDRQVKSKVFDLAAMEERVVKSGLEKAKADNKFYSAMRDKEAVDAERKNLSRNLEKQSKVIDKLLEEEKKLAQEFVDQEAYVKKLLEAKAEQHREFEKLQVELQNQTRRADGESKRYLELKTVAQNLEKSLGAKVSELSKLTEQCSALKRENERQATRMKAMSASPSSHKEIELQSEVDKCMAILKCSICKMQMRSTVITKCMHSFCKQCVDARIATRQRKCPACNLQFAQSEVQPLYFQ